MERAFVGLVVVNLAGAVRALVGIEQTPTSTAATDIISLVVQLGLSGVFLWQWHNERQERIRRDEQLIDMATKMSPLLEQATEALRDVHAGLASTVARQEVLPRRADVVARRQEIVADEMRDVLEQLRPLATALQQITPQAGPEDG